MTVGAQNVQSANCGYLVMLDVGLRFVAIEGVGPSVGGDGVLVAVVIKNRGLAIFLGAFDFALGHAQLLRDSLLDQFLLSHELGIAAEQNVRAAAGHVGRDRDHALASGLGDDFGFAL